MCTTRGVIPPPKVFKLQRDTLSLHFQRVFHRYMLRLLILISFLSSERDGDGGSKGRADEEGSPTTQYKLFQKIFSVGANSSIIVLLDDNY